MQHINKLRRQTSVYTATQRGFEAFVVVWIHSEWSSVNWIGCVCVSAVRVLMWPSKDFTKQFMCSVVLTVQCALERIRRKFTKESNPKCWMSCTLSSLIFFSFVFIVLLRFDSTIYCFIFFFVPHPHPVFLCIVISVHNDCNSIVFAFVPNICGDVLQIEQLYLYSNFTFWKYCSISLEKCDVTDDQNEYSVHLDRTTTTNQNIKRRIEDKASSNTIKWWSIRGEGLFV